MDIAEPSTVDKFNMSIGSRYKSTRYKGARHPLEFSGSPQIGVNALPHRKWNPPAMVPTSTIIRHGSGTVDPAPPRFWVDHPASLMSSLEVWPRADMSDEERLNAMTRGVIIISAIMFLFKFPAWSAFLVVGIMTVIVMWLSMMASRRQPRIQREFIRRPIIAPIQPPVNHRIRLVGRT